MFIIQDWASNTLQHDGKFNFGKYGKDMGVPMEFQSFEDALEWIDTNISDDEKEDLYVDCKK